VDGVVGVHGGLVFQLLAVMPRNTVIDIAHTLSQPLMGYLVRVAIKIRIRIAA